MDRPSIEVEGLSKAYGARQVLRGITFSVAPGRLLALLGPNGSGKTTTVRILTTLLAPGAGTARVAGHDVVADASAVRRTIGLTAQQATVDGLLTGRENLELFGRLHRLGAVRARRRAAELLDRFDLLEAAGRRVSTYSGGMRRRIDLAASLVAEPTVLFLDEPTTGLDPRSRHALWDAVRERLAGGTTVLLTTQYLEEADALADDIAVLRDGCIVAGGSPESLKRRVGEERLAVRVPGADAAAAAAAAGWRAAPPDRAPRTRRAR
ncbi:ABC transporter ATP-binding protein [Georgenia sp. SUBG003]|uniref:ABC transporter ATP-binding protein n=1 Tax=Georgenia sp. SUBG003 TaxID=1497974 RepID=UPI003AB1C856